MVNGEPIPEEDLESFSDPNAALYAALKAIAKDDWWVLLENLGSLR